MYFWLMKKLLSLATITLILFSISCTENKKTYYEEFTDHKAFVSRILDLNKTIDEIRKEEKGELIKEDVHFLEYVYKIGKSDSYVISYLFDEKGCYEIGIDGYFELEKDALSLVVGIKTETDAKYGKGTDDNNLNQWKNEDKSISIELDYKDTARGLFLATIFANE